MLVVDRTAGESGERGFLVNDDRISMLFSALFLVFTECPTALELSFPAKVTLTSGS